MRSYLCCAITLGLLALGCGDDTTGTRGGGGTTASTTTGSTTGTTTSTTTVTTSTGTATSTSTGMAVCPPDPNDSACLACSKASCCDQTTACMADAACVTCMACVDMGNAEQCVQTGDCDLSNPATADGYECTANACSDECYQGGFSCAANANDTPCEACTKMNCCMQAQDCFASASCAACIQCVQTTGDPFACIGMGQCDAQEPATSAMFTCTQQSCNQQCLN